MNKIKFSKPYIDNVEKKEIINAFNSTYISVGKYNMKFENYFKNIINRKYALTVCNGTIAVELAASALGLKKNDEIIIPSLLYISPVHIFKKLGLRLTICKVNPENFQMDVNSLKNCIKKKTRAILLIYNYGNTPNIREILYIAKKKKIKIIEDFSEATFTKYNNTYVGKFGDISIGSLHATKTITAGEGGIVVTDNKKLFKKMHKIREHGYLNKKEPYTYSMIGSNYKMSNINAAIAYGQLKKYKIIIKKRLEILKIYKQIFQKLDKFILLPRFHNNEKNIMWAIPIFIKKNNITRKIIKYLKTKNIEVRPSFKMIYNYKHLNLKKLKELNISKNIILLPCHPFIQKKEIIYIAKKIIWFLLNTKNRLSKQTVLN